MKLDIFDLKGNKVESTSIKDFEPNKEVLSQYLRVYYTNQRQGTVSTKTRGEVSGGGKKPWRQKHTGRARQGSIRSPIWAHGGVAHGPKPKDWSLDQNKKVKTLAFMSALAEKANSKKLFVVDDLKFESPKTKEFFNLLSNLKVEDTKVLVIWSTRNDNLILSCSNIPDIYTAFAGNVSTFDLLRSHAVIITRDALKMISERYNHENK